MDRSAAPEGGPLAEAMEKGGGRLAIWKRALFMLLFALIYSIAELVVFFAALFQLVFVLIARRRNEQVLELGQSLSTYIYQILRFLTFNSERLPFPFSDWPPGSKGPEVRE